MSKFAPLYSTRERVLIALKILAAAGPVYIAGYYWIFPWLRRYAITANCDQFGAFNGLELLVYGLFVGMPLSMALLLWLIEGRRSLRVWRLGQSPLPGEKVLRRTRYRFGTAARIRPLAMLVIVALLIGIAIRGGIEGRKLAHEIGPCEALGSPPASSRKPQQASLQTVRIDGSAIAEEQPWQYTSVKSAA